MRFASLAGPLAGLALSILLGGCSLEAAMSSCANCGEVKFVTPRAVHDEIRLYTDAPEAVPVALEPSTRVVYHVRVRMDRGGSRDFLLPRDPQLHPGDRVEVQGSELTVRAATGHRWS